MMKIENERSRRKSNGLVDESNRDCDDNDDRIGSR